MENKAHALVAGLFLLLLGAMAVVALVWFRGDHIQRLPYTVVAQTGVPGLAVKAAVRLRGVDVGNVEAIQFDPADPRRILVKIAVDSAAPLTRGTVAQLGYQGVTGLSFIALSDRGDDPRLLAALPDAQRQIELKPSILDQLATSGPALLVAFSQTAERLNTLLSPQNQQRLAALLDSSERAASRVAERAQELRPAVAALPPLLKQLDQATRRAETTLQRVDGTADQAGRLVADLRGKLPALDRVGEAAARVEAAARSIELGLVGATPPTGVPLLDTLGQTARGVDRTVLQLSDQPQSLVFGRTPPAPGPGEAGFDAVAKGAR